MRQDQLTRIEKFLTFPARLQKSYRKQWLIKNRRFLKNRLMSEKCRQEEFIKWLYQISDELKTKIGPHGEERTIFPYGQ